MVSSSGVSNSHVRGLSTRCLVPKDQKLKKHTATISVESLHVGMRWETRLPERLPGHERVPPPHPHSPPAASHCVSLRGHPAGFNGDTRAAGCAARLAPPMNQMRQVQLRWITVIPAWVCSSVHTRAAYLMSPKERGGGGKERKAHHTEISAKTSLCWDDY